MRRNTLELPLKAFAVAASAWFLMGLSVNGVAAGTGGLLEPLKPNTTVDLYEAPGAKKSVQKAMPSDMPLHAEGPAQNGYYPVRLGKATYWVDGMDVKMKRDSNAPCTQSAGVHAAGTLGAATNRCK